MDEIELYNTNYTKLNHTYNEIFHFYEQLLSCKKKNKTILAGIETILRIFNPTLDEIKSKMTVKTRFVESGESESAENQENNFSEENPNIEKNKNGGRIFKLSFPEK